MNEIIIEKELLESLYWGNQYTKQDISKIFNCSRNVIYIKFNKYNIQTRTVSDNMKIVHPKPTYRICRSCSIRKPIKEFHKNGTSGAGYHYKCKDCRNREQREYISVNPNRVHKVAKKCREKHKQKYLDATRKWKKTKNGKLSKIKSENKRRRNLKFVPLFYNIFPDNVDVDYHHINNLIVIPLPRKIHSNTSSIREVHREQCNDIINQLYNINIPSLLCD